MPGEHVTWEGWEDSAVPPDKVGPYLRDLCKLYDKYGYEGALYGHLSVKTLRRYGAAGLITLYRVGPKLLRCW